MTKTLTSKKILALVLALAMAFSVMAVSAYAASDEVGVPIPWTTQLWWQDTEFTVEFTQVLTISGVDTTFELGYNTIQEVVLRGSDYILSAHPQYFPNYDNYVTADYVMELRSIAVWDSDNEVYVDCYNSGFAIIPEEYTLYNDLGDPYLQCIIFSYIEDIDTGDFIPARWNGQVAYFAIPELD
jgi:uncharacterized protein (UPF0297 family)